MKWFLASLFIVFALLLPAIASADDGKEDNGLTLRVTGDVTVAKGETVGAVVVIDGNATIDGTVTDSLTVINGTAIVTGTVAKATSRSSPARWTCAPAPRCRTST